MMLTPDCQQWADHELATQVTELKKQALALRRRGAKHLPIRPATEVVAAAYDRAAIELERSRRSINSAHGEGADPAANRSPQVHQPVP